MMQSTGSEAGLRKHAVLWLLVLAPTFFATYGFATWVTSRRTDVGTLVFAWETIIPFWAWTIVPYWTIDLLYGFSLLLPTSSHELRRHALRLMSAQIIAVSCFLIWPLRFTFDRPELGGIFGWLFAVLGGFDKPFNQAPSLHIALLVILWVLYHQHSKGIWRWLVHGWFVLIGISVLTTYQHHFVDLPTGVLAGWLCVWLWPMDRTSPLMSLRVAKEPKRWRLAFYYGLGAAVFATPLVLGGGWLWLVWPTVTFLMVALNYALLDAAGFQKQASGNLSVAARWLFAPYVAAAWTNSRLWTRKHPQPHEVVDDVWLGRLPDAKQLSPFKAVVDLCAELPLSPRGRAYQSVPVLDLIAPDLDQCMAAARAIEHLRQQGPLLVCCALGYSRSATAVAAWLLHTGRARTVTTAVAMMQAARTEIVLHPAHRRALEKVYAR